jgi:hypothetical protein
MKATNTENWAFDFFPLKLLFPVSSVSFMFYDISDEAGSGAIAGVPSSQVQ